MSNINKVKRTEYRKAQYEANREKERAQGKAWREANLEKAKALNKTWNEKNREKRAALNKAYYENNRGRMLAKAKNNYEKVKNQPPEQVENYRKKAAARLKKYRARNPDKVNARTAKRRAQKLQATPKWMDKEDFAAIEEWYQIAKELQWLSEEPLQVDHIIPLQGKEVCGLHIAANLQILPASENVSKGNRIADHMVKYNETDFIKEVVGD